MSALKISTRAELEAALAKAQREAENKVAIKMGPVCYEWTIQQQEMFMENVEIDEKQAVREAHAPIWAAWWESPEGKEEKRLAEEAERARIEEKNALHREKEAMRLAYVKTQGFDTVTAYIDYVNSTWIYCRDYPWVSWMTCVRRVRLPSDW
jgi:hypothetical protein